MKICIHICTLFLPVFLISCSDDTLSEAEDLFISRPDSVVTIVENGELESINNTFVYTPSEWSMTYRITYLVPEGSYVQEGDTVVGFDREEAQSELEEAQANLDLKLARLEETLERNAVAIKEKQNAVRQLEIQNDINKNRLEQARFESEVNRKKMELELEKSRLSLQKARADLESQKILNQKDEAMVRLEIRQARVDIDRARATLSDMFLVAPKGGMVVYQRQGWGSDGEKVREGDTVRPRNGLLAIPDLNTMRVLVKLNEVDRPFVNEGQIASIKIEAYPDTVFSGEVEFVSRIVNQTDDANNLKTYDVGVVIHAQENFRLKPGLSAEVALDIAAVTDAYSVPSFCLFGSEQALYLKSPDRGQLDVKLIQLRDGVAYVSGEGLKEGLRIVNNPGIPVF